MMRSPFAIFRKHARVLTVVLTGLAMFAFVVMDQMRSNPQLFPIIMAGMLLGVAFWILGRPSGHANEYGVGGLLLGVILMAYVVPNFSRPAAAVGLSTGSLSRQDVNDQMRRMQVANQFVSRARAAAGQQQRQGQRFGFSPDAQENAAMLSILKHEADEMGIRLSDDAVNNFIKRETDGKLSKAKFKKVRTDLRLSETELYDTLRVFLRAELAYGMLVPRVHTTPAEFWEYYRRLNVKQEIEVAAIPVAEFESDKAPGDEAIAQFFDKYKDKAPTRLVIPEPAFRQPRKIQIAYLEIDYNQIRTQLEKDSKFKVTNEDVEEFYEENKALLYSKRPDPEDVPPFDDGKSPDESKPIDPVIAPDPTTKPKNDGPDKEPQPEKKPDAPKASKPIDKPQEKPNENGGQFSVDDAVDADVGEKSAGDKSAGEKSTDDKDKADTESSKAPADSSATEDDDSPISPVEAPIPGEKTGPPPVEYQPLDDELKAEIRETLLKQRMDNATDEAVTRIRNRAEEFMYDLRNEIIDDYDRKDDPTEEEQAARATKITGRVKAFAKQQGLRYVELDLFGYAKLTDRGDEAAELWNEIQGAEETPTAKERKTLDYLVAQATEPREPGDMSRSEPQTVLQRYFSQPEDRLFSRQSAQDPISSNQYVYWKLEDKPSEVPSLDDPGVRDQVITALKVANARKPAEERAKALAGKVRAAVKNEKTMEEALEGEKVNPSKNDGENLVVVDTEESFSWLTIPTARSPSPFAPAQPSLAEPTAIEHAGNDFMRVVFDELNEGDVGVAANADQTIFYVVRVKNRVEAAPGGEPDFREAYLQQDFYPKMESFGGREFGPFPTTYTFLTNADASVTARRWRQQLLDKYEYRPSAEEE